jgi:hypothetical protein
MQIPEWNNMADKIDCYPGGGIFANKTNSVGKTILATYIMKRELKMENILHTLGFMVN